MATADAKKIPGTQTITAARKAACKAPARKASR